jgi:hypothetical protein
VACSAPAAGDTARARCSGNAIERWWWSRRQPSPENIPNCGDIDHDSSAFRLQVTVIDPAEDGRKY